MLSIEDAAVFFWGTIQRWQTYQTIIAEVRDHWLDVAGQGESREVDTFGVLLAGALTAQDCPVARVHDLLKKAVPEIIDQIEDARAASSEADLILGALLSLQIEVQRHEDAGEQGGERINREKISISRALNMVRQNRGPEGKCDEALALEDVGLALKEKDGREYLAVALRHASLSRLLQGTRWKRDGSWTGGLRDAPGVIRNYPAQIAGTRLKATWIPLDVLGLTDDVPAKVFPAKGVYQFSPPLQPF
jgi:hypothetical protein